MNLSLPHVRTGRLATMAIWLAAAAQLVVGVLTVGLAGRVDPVRDPVSDYVFQRAGKPLFALAVLLVLTGGAVLAVAAHRAGVPRSTAVTVLFGAWLAALVVVLVFPGNVSATESTVHGEIHRLAGAVLYGSLPLACAEQARRMQRNPRWTVNAARLRWCAGAGLITAGAFGLAQFVGALPQGLLERVALSAELLILVVAAVTVRGSARRAAP